MSSIVMVDTNIWQFAFMTPREKEFVQIHDLAGLFLTTVLEDESVRIAATSYQVAEIVEVLRKSGYPNEKRMKILHDFEKPKFFVKDLMLSDVTRACEDSSKSNVHVYDYLVVSPLKGVVDRIYSADEHFKHDDFQRIATVANPLEPWFVTEGKHPEKKNK
jgi:predicted nucleic acid-binding protein